MAKNKKLDLNPKKCKILIFKKNKPFDPIDLLINNTKIPTFKCLKDLRMYMYENLEWNEHINYLYNAVQV